MINSEKFLKNGSEFVYRVIFKINDKESREGLLSPSLTGFSQEKYFQDKMLSSTLSARWVRDQQQRGCHLAQVRETELGMKRISHGTFSGKNSFQRYPSGIYLRKTM